MLKAPTRMYPSSLLGGARAPGLGSFGDEVPTRWRFRATDIRHVHPDRLTINFVAATTLTAIHYGRTLTNIGTTVKVQATLPAAVAPDAAIGAATIAFSVADTDGIRVVAPAGVTITLAGSASTVAGYVESTQKGAFLKLMAISATEWLAQELTGTWTAA